MAKIMSGLTDVQFTTMKTSKDAVNVYDLETLTALTNIMQTASISNIRIKNNTEILVTALFNNTALDTGYNCNTVGLFATDPDLGEILYAAMTVIDGVGDYMPSTTEKSNFSIGITDTIAVGNSTSISLTVDVAGAATVGMLNDLESQLAESRFFDIVNHKIGDGSIDPEEPPITYITYSGSKYDYTTLTAVMVNADGTDGNTASFAIEPAYGTLPIAIIADDNTRPHPAYYIKEQNGKVIAVKSLDTWINKQFQYGNTLASSALTVNNATASNYGGPLNFDVNADTSVTVSLSVSRFTADYPLTVRALSATGSRTDLYLYDVEKPVTAPAGTTRIVVFYYVVIAGFGSFYNLFWAYDVPQIATEADIDDMFTEEAS
jgi:hypothetical protein